ncbi:hypothetical protein BGW42_004642 [Actinomortierella wolfii]|nr:hypothetical protein BGW42_004642 [Actinomortierella wolfii]
MRTCFYMFLTPQTPEEKERLFRSRGVPLSKSELAAAAGMSTDSATELKGSLRSVPGAQQGPVDSDFLGGAWDHLLETYGLPDYKPSTLQKYKGSSPIIAVSLSDIPNNEALYQGKIEALVVLIKECKVTELDTSVVVIDPSGEMRGTIHRKVMEHYKNNEIRVGTALALHNISIFSPTPVSHYLNITMANIAGVFTPTPTIISLSQCSSSPRTQRSLSQSSRGEGRERDTRTIKRQRSQTDSSQQSADIDPSPTRLRQLQEEEFQLSMGFAPKSPTPLHPRKRRLPRRPSPDWEDVVEEDSQEAVSASNATGEGRGQGGDDDESIKEREMAAGVDYSPVVTEETLTRNNSQRRGVSKEIEEVEEGLEEEEEDEPLVRHRQSGIRRIPMPKREPPIIKDEPGEAAKETQAEPIHEIQFQSLPQATGRSNDDDDKRILTANASQTGEDDFTFPQMGATPMGILGGPTPREQQPVTPPTLAHPLPPAESKGEGGSNGDGKRTSGASSSGRALLSSFAAPKNLQRRSTFNAPHSSTMPIHGPSPLSATAVPAAAKSSTSPLPATLTRDPSSNDDWLDGVDEAALNVADLEDDGDFGVTSGQQQQKEEVKEDMKEARAGSAQIGGSNIPPPTTASSSVQQLQKVVEGTEDDDFDFLLQGIDENELFDEES